MEIIRLFPVLLLILFSCGSSYSLIEPNELAKLNYKEVKIFAEVDSKENPEIEKYPMYPGGVEGLMEDIGKELKYPELERRSAIEGRVWVKYIIEKNGYIEEIEITKGLSPGFDAEVKRVIKSLKRWHPGFNGRKPIRVEFDQPFDFALN